MQEKVKAPARGASGKQPAKKKSVSGKLKTLLFQKRLDHIVVKEEEEMKAEEMMEDVKKAEAAKAGAAPAAQGNSLPVPVELKPIVPFESRKEVVPVQDKPVAPVGRRQVVAGKQGKKNAKKAGNSPESSK
jgi:hypothetical protein